MRIINERLLMLYSIVVSRVRNAKKILTTFSSEASIEKRRCSSNATLVHKGNFREIAKRAKRNSDVGEP